MRESEGTCSRRKAVMKVEEGEPDGPLTGRLCVVAGHAKTKHTLLREQATHTQKVGSDLDFDNPVWAPDAEMSLSEARKQSMKASVCWRGASRQGCLYPTPTENPAPHSDAGENKPQQKSGDPGPQRPGHPHQSNRVIWYF